jgi:hypothetical protein
MSGGVLDFIAEAVELQQQLGCSAEEAFQIQRQLATKRLDYERATVESNVIPFRQKH